MMLQFHEVRSDGIPRCWLVVGTADDAAEATCHSEAPRRVSQGCLMPLRSWLTFSDLG